MGLYSTLFPIENRSFPMLRWTKIIIRTLHLVGITGLGAIFFSSPHNYDFIPFAIIAYITGLLFVALEIWSNGVWLIQLRGIAIYLKVTILALLFLFPGYETVFIIILIIISGMISHAPADVRYFSLFHGRRLSSLSK